MKLSERIRDYAEGEERIVKWANGVAQLEEENDALKLENGKLERIIQAKIIAMKHLATEEQHERR